MYGTYNQYVESFTLPLVAVAEAAWRRHPVRHSGANQHGEFNIHPDRKVARRIDWIRGGQRSRGLDLTENNLVFVTNGSLVENFPPGATTIPQPRSTR